MVIDLDEVVAKLVNSGDVARDDFLETEYITTVFIVVPRCRTRWFGHAQEHSCIRTQRKSEEVSNKT